MLRVHVAADAADRAPLASRIAAFEKHHHLQAVAFDMLLEFDQLRLVRGEREVLRVDPQGFLLLLLRQAVRIHLLWFR